MGGKGRHAMIGVVCKRKQVSCKLKIAISCPAITTPVLSMVMYVHTKELVISFAACLLVEGAHVSTSACVCGVWHQLVLCLLSVFM